MNAKWEISRHDIEILEERIKALGLEIASPVKTIIVLFLFLTRKSGPKDASTIKSALFMTVGRGNFHLSTALADLADEKLLAMDMADNYTLTEEGVEWAKELNRLLRLAKKYNRQRRKLQAQSASFFIVDKNLFLY